MSCMRLAKSTGRKLSPKIRTNLSGYFLATNACIDNRKKVVKHQYLLHMSSQYGEFRPTNGWDRLVDFGQGSKFQRAQRRSTKLQNVWPWAVTLCIHFRRLLPPEGILPGAKFTLRPSLAFTYTGSGTARHSRSVCQPNCGVQQRAPPIFGRRPSPWASVHILVHKILLLLCPLLQFQPSISI